MSTIQVEGKVKKELFAVAADLQKRFGKKVSLNDAINHLMRSFGLGLDVVFLEDSASNSATK
jgi:hypothetical protein